MREIYNKSALDMINSQDQLDQAVHLVPASLWMSIIAAFLILGGLFVWGFTGSVPQEVNATGIYLEDDDFFDEYSSIKGIVTEVKFAEGDLVAKGDLLISTSTDDDFHQLKQMDERIAYVENITFESDLDYITNDSEPLAEIKTKVAGVDITSDNTKASLELKKKRLAELEGDLAKKEARLLKEKEAYFSTLPISDKTAQTRYTEASTTFETRASLYESAKQNYISAKESYLELENNFNKQYEYYDSSTASIEEIEQRDAALQKVQDAANKVADMKAFMEKEAANLERADSELSNARKEYLEKDNDDSGIQAENTMSQSEYSEALNDYNTVLSEVRNLRNQIDDLELKSVVDEAQAEINIEVYKQEFDNKKSSILYDLNNKRKDLLKQVNKSNVYAAHNGIIKDVLVKEGMSVQEGTKLFTLRNSERILFSSKSEANLIFCFVALKDARKIEEGMEAHVFPSTVNKQEYGHIVGTVESVNKSISSKDEILDTTGSEALTEQFYKQGPVVKIVISLKEDAESASGFKWSTKKGKDLALEGTTLVDVSVEQSHKKPIELLITGVKDKLEFKRKDDKGKTEYGE